MREQLKLNRTKCVSSFFVLECVKNTTIQRKTYHFDKWTPFATTLGFVIALTEMSYNLTNI